jgi:hypothetical protein
MSVSAPEMRILAGCRYPGLSRPLGGLVPRYGAPDEVCSLPGCGVYLSAYNPLDRCSLHELRAQRRTVRERDEDRWHRLPEAEPERRRPTILEVEMAAKRRAKTGETRAAIASWLGEHDRGSVEQVAEGVGINASGAHKHLAAMLEEGKLSRRKNGHGYLYLLRTACPREQTHAADPLPATAPARPSRPEQAADPAPPLVPAPDEEEPAAVTTTLGELSVELEILTMLEALGFVSRRRVLAYACSRWP